MIFDRGACRHGAVLLLCSTVAISSAGAADRVDNADEVDAAASISALERSLARSGGALLSEGQKEVEFGFQYESTKRAEARTVLSVGTLAARAALPWTSQLEIVIPYVREKVDSEVASGIGDLLIGVAKELDSDREGSFDWILELAYERSTGRASGSSVANRTLAMAPSTGQGHDALHLTVTAVKHLEPAELVISLGPTFSRSATVEGLRVRPGIARNLAVSAHFDASESISLRTGFSLTWHPPARVNGVSVSDSRTTIGILEVGASASLSHRTLLDISLGIGMTRDSPDIVIGVSLPILF